MTYNNSNRKNIREAEKTEKLADANRIAYTKQIMSSLFGRAWMYQLLSRCNIFHIPFVAGMSDVTSFNCGSQNIGLPIFAEVTTHCPNEYALMMQEASIKDEVNGRRYESGNDIDGTASERRNGNPAESGSYSTDHDGFVIDNSGDQARDEAGDEVIH